MNADRVRLVLVADTPSVGEDGVLRAVEAVVHAIPGERVLLVDRDLPPSRGGPTDRARLRRLATLRALTREAGALLAVTARVDLALASDADGVQLPERGLDAGRVRRRFPGLLVGRSCHDRAGLEAAQADGAHWALLSPVWAPLSKAPTGSPMGPDGFARAVAGLDLPVFGLGGVRTDRAGALLEAGAAGVAVVGAVFGADDPGGTARALLSPWDDGPRRGWSS
ncbi:MAG: thiamine phosphate synthase [Myxococcota bacterium]